MNAAQLKDKLLTYVSAEVLKHYQRDKVYFGYHVRLVLGVLQSPHLQAEDYTVQLVQQRIEPAQYMQPINAPLGDIAPGHIQLEWLMMCSPSVHACYEPESQYLWKVCRWLLQQCEMRNEACGATWRRVEASKRAQQREAEAKADQQAQEASERRADEARTRRLARRAVEAKAREREQMKHLRKQERLAREAVAREQAALTRMERLSADMCSMYGRELGYTAKLDTLQELLEITVEEAVQILHRHGFHQPKSVEYHCVRNCCPHAERSITPKWRAPRYTLDRYDGQPDCMD